jgi:hypothetical protein
MDAIPEFEMPVRRRPIYVLLGAVAAIGLWLAWSGIVSTSLFHRESPPPPVAVTVLLPPAAPAPAEPAPSQPAPLAEPTPPPTEPMVAAVPPAPSAAVPVGPPEPFVVDRRAISRVQFYLEQLGYQVGAADGAMGRRTRTAILAFRVANGLPRNEEVDGALIDALDLALRQRPPKPADGVPAAAPRIPVERIPLSNSSR